ncbi:MAG: nucleotidyltransferase domain-containing protein [Nanoarchaeota archaeon]|nr:nucleotidyltransferase domain-containing protein [Nanoarchaeota archaeon]
METKKLKAMKSAALEVSNELSENPKISAIYITGSVATGKIGKTSDVDMAAVVEKNEDIPEGLNSWNAKSIRKKDFEISIMYKVYSKLKQDIEREAGCGILSGSIDSAWIIYDPKNLIKYLKSYAKNIPENLKKQVTVGWINESKSHLGKVEYSLKKKDKILAAQMLRYALNDYIHALLIDRKTPILGEKFIFEQLKSLDIPNFWKIFLEVESFDKLNSNKIKDDYKKVRGLIKELENKK